MVSTLSAQDRYFPESPHWPFDAINIYSKILNYLRKWQEWSLNRKWRSVSLPQKRTEAAIVHIFHFMSYLRRRIHLRWPQETECGYSMVESISFLLHSFGWCCRPSVPFTTSISEEIILLRRIFFFCTMTTPIELSPSTIEAIVTFLWADADRLHKGNE